MKKYVLAYRNIYNLSVLGEVHFCNMCEYAYKCFVYVKQKQQSRCFLVTWFADRRKSLLDRP